MNDTDLTVLLVCFMLGTVVGCGVTLIIQSLGSKKYEDT